MQSVRILGHYGTTVLDSAIGEVRRPGVTEEMLEPQHIRSELACCALQASCIDRMANICRT